MIRERERERVENGVYLVFVETEQNAVFHVFVEAKNYLTELRELSREKLCPACWNRRCPLSP